MKFWCCVVSSLFGEAMFPAGANFPGNVYIVVGFGLVFISFFIACGYFSYDITKLPLD